MTTYTVFNSNDPEVNERGLTLEQAAARLLTEDGHEYEIREEDGLFELFYSRHSRNSTMGAKLTSYAGGNFVDSNRDRLLQKIVMAEWCGAEAMLDDEFTHMMAENND